MDKTEAAEKLAAAIEEFFTTAIPNLSPFSPVDDREWSSVDLANYIIQYAPAIAPERILPEGLTVAQVYRVLVCVGTANTGLDLVEAIAVSEALRKAVDHE